MCRVHSVVGYLGCYNCISELNRCPVCRRKFQSNICHCNFPKSPLFIPGIGEYLSLPEVRRQTIDKGNESDGSLSQVSTIPATDNLPDLAHPESDETDEIFICLYDYHLFCYQITLRDCRQNTLPL